MVFFDPPGEQRRAPECIFHAILMFFVPKLGIKELNSHGKKGFFVPMWDQRTVWEDKKRASNSSTKDAGSGSLTRTVFTIVGRSHAVGVLFSALSQAGGYLSAVRVEGV